MDVMPKYDDQDIWRYFNDPNVKFPHSLNWLSDVIIVRLPHDLGYRFVGSPLCTIVQGTEIGTVMPFLQKHINGTQNIHDILAQIPAGLSKRATLKTLQLLHFNGLLVQDDRGTTGLSEGSLELVERESLFWSRQLTITGAVRTEAEFRKSLADSKVTLIGTGLLGASVLRALETAGIKRISCIGWADDGFFSEASKFADSLSTTSSKPELEEVLQQALVDDESSEIQGKANRRLVLVATRNAPRELLRAISRLCLRHNNQLLYCNEVDSKFELGPLVEPYSSACFHCLEIRELHSNQHSVEEHYFHQQIMSSPNLQWAPRGESLLVSGLIAHLAVMEVVRVMTHIAQPTLVNQVLTISPIIGEMRSNTIIRVPWCPECGGSKQNAV